MNCIGSSKRVATAVLPCGSSWDVANLLLFFAFFDGKKLFPL
jgi:hypothetical protein